MEKIYLVLILIGLSLFINLNLIESKQISTMASVEVNPAYDLDINIEILNDKVVVGENLSVFVELKKTDLTNIAEEISVDLNYEITKNGAKKEIIESGFLKTIDITDEKTEIVEIQVSSDLKGKYILKIIASNPQSFSEEDSETFVVMKKRSSFLSLLENLINRLFSYSWKQNF